MQQSRQYLLGFIWLLAACSNPNNTNNETVTAEQKEDPPQSCEYSYDNSSTQLYWTAFKHTARVEVKGQMDSIKVSGTVAAENMIDVIKEASIILYPKSVDSKDPIRDQKITSSFFGSMENTEEITASIKSVNGNDEKGTGTLSLTLNNFTKDVAMEYIVEGETIQFRCALDFMDWNCTDAMANLQKACEEQHKGVDGKPVFWPDAKILIETTLQKDCN